MDGLSSIFLPGINLNINQSLSGHHFGPEIFALAEFTGCLRFKKVVELGTGCGALLLLLAKKNASTEFYGIEYCVDLLKIARFNVVSQGLGMNIRFIATDLSKGFTFRTGICDLVVANPPFYRKGSGEVSVDPLKVMARQEGDVSIQTYCSWAKYLLKHKGKFVSLFLTERLVDIVTALRSEGLEPKRLAFLKSPTRSRSRLFAIEAVKGGRVGLCLNPSIEIDSSFAWRYA